jgi:Ca2+-binding EF-hand superfamily protein
LNYNEFVVGSLGVKLAEMFKSLDKDGSGKLERSEMIELVNSVSREEIPDEVVTKVISKIDVDGDGTIDRQEFLAAVVTLRELVASEHNALKKTHQEDAR